MERQNLYSSSDIIKMITLNRTKCEGHVARMRVQENVHKDLV
jgi:hypothetical protein